MLIGGGVALIGELLLVVCGVDGGILEPMPAAVGAFAGYASAMRRYPRPPDR
jgi:hypothetical protein